MVKLNGPLMSQNASGAFAKNLTFQTRGNKKLVRRFHYPKKQPTGEQLAQRYIIGLLTARWQTMTASEKAVWNLAAKEYQEKNKKPMTGFNYWIKIAQTDLYTYYNMVAFYPMNEGSGLKSFDYSGNNMTLTLQSVSPAIPPVFVDSENNSFYKCLYGDGTSKSGEALYNSKMNFSDKLSFGFWIRIDEKLGVQRFALYRNLGFGFYQHTNNSCVCYVTLNSVSRGVALLSSEWIPGRWMHVFCTFDGTLASAQLKLYINGRFLRQSNTVGLGTNETTSLNVLSYSSMTRPLIGAIDNLLITKRVVPASEVLKIYQIMHSNKERQQLP